MSGIVEVSSSGTPVPTAPDRARGDWTQMADCIERFCVEWEGNKTPPNLQEFVPPENSQTRRLTLIELVKVDLEQRWTHKSDPRSVEQYLDQWPDLKEPDGSAPCDLVYEEFHIRRQSGEDVRLSEFVARFPGLTDRLRRLIGQADSVESSSMRGASRQKITLQPGDTIDDFDLLTRLGAGAFATVFLARQKSMQRLCALKVSVTRSNEAQTLAQLDHPNIVRVYDQRIIPEKNVRLLYMQYVAGASLSEVLDQLRLLPKSDWSGTALLKAISRQLQESGSGFGVTGTAHEHPLHRRLQKATWPETVCLFGIQVASALQYAHEQGVLHRDLKPANILLDENGAPKIVDFNISFCSKLDGVTPAAYFGGSLAYMSPEQLEVCHPDHAREADDVDARSDQYSLSVLLWEMLCGQRPFNDHVSDRSWPAALASAGQLRTQQPDLRHFGQLPFASVTAIRDVLLRALANDREKRFGAAEELARELRYCTEPETMASLRPGANLWRGFVIRRPLLVLTAIVMGANGIAAFLNLVYNKEQIVDHLPEILPNADKIFNSIQIWINTIAFPLGLGLGMWLAWPVIRGVTQGVASVPDADAVRRRSLHIGNMLALLGASEWLLAGIIYPIAMNSAGAALTVHLYSHFFVSLALCGGIAATYPFFFITWIAVRAFYPKLLSGKAIPLSDVDSLRSIHRMTWGYLALAAALPLVGVMLFVLLTEGQERWVPGLLSVTGLMGFGVLFVVARSLQNSLALLVEAIEISNDPSSLRTDSMRIRM